MTANIITALHVTSRRVAYARAAHMTHHARKATTKKRGEEEVSFRHRLLYLCELAAPRRHQNRRARPAEPGSRLLVRDAARAHPFLPPPWGVSRAKPENNQSGIFTQSERSVHEAGVGGQEVETILGSHLPEYSKTFHGKTIISGATIWLDRAHTSRGGLVSRPRIEGRFASPWEPKASSVPRDL